MGDFAGPEREAPPPHLHAAHVVRVGHKSGGEHMMQTGQQRVGRLRPAGARGCVCGVPRIVPPRDSRVGGRGVSGTAWAPTEAKIVPRVPG